MTEDTSTPADQAAVGGRVQMTPGYLPQEPGAFPLLVDVVKVDLASGNGVPANRDAPTAGETVATLGDWALWYAGRGWPVFPVEPGAKEPIGALVPKGVLNATTDAATITRWWGRRPTAGIGLATGYGFDVVDVDLPDGPASLDELRTRTSLLARPFAEVATPSGGMHLWLPVDADMKSRVGFRPGLDYRGRGAYVVAPPSRGRNGCRYAFSSPPADPLPLEVPVPNEGDPPYLRLSEMLDRNERRGPPLIDTDTQPVSRTDPPPSVSSRRAAAYIGAALTACTEAVAAAPEHTRNNTLYANAAALGRLHHLGLDEHRAAEAMADGCRRNGLGGQEVRKAFRSGWKHGIADPKDLGDDETFTADGWGAVVLDTTPTPIGEHQDAGDPTVYPSPADPTMVADQIIAELYTAAGKPLLQCQSRVFYHWDGTRWPRLDDQDVRTVLYRTLKGAVFTTGTGTAAWRPNIHRVNNVLDALRSAVELSRDVSTPAWLGDGYASDPHDLVPMRNGLLNLRTRQLHPPTPDYWSHHALPFDYERNPGEPKRWVQFLKELFDDDDESIQACQEIIGYLLSGDTRLQKIFLLVGPKRSGKGTIGRVLRGLVGAHNYAGPTLSGLATQFGLQPLLGASVAVISDARLSARAEHSAVVERLLAISGEDEVTVDIKHREPWRGPLPIRFVILTNELPALRDVSGALASRFVVLRLVNSFYGKEDPLLTDKLLAEAPRIFNWALEGLASLRARGHFLQPASAKESLETLEDLGSPVGGFVRECCDVDPEAEIGTNALYRAFSAWCFEQGIHRASSDADFGKDLLAAVPTVRKTRPREDGERVHRYVGIKLRPPATRAASTGALGPCAGCGVATRRYGPGGRPRCDTCQEGAT